MPFELVPAGTQIDFLGKRQICVMVSIGLIALGAVFAGLNGIRLGIDFAGGTEVQLLFDEGVAVDEEALRNLTDEKGFTSAQVVRFGDDEGVDEFLIKFKSVEEGSAAAAEVARLESEADAEGSSAIGLESNTRVVVLEGFIQQEIGGHTEQRVEYVGPRVGAELRQDGLKALGLSAIAILIYVAFRFSSRFAPGAVVAVVHDLAITAGILVILGEEFDLRILAAMLAILGYSLNDTIIIYDRIRENMELHTTADLEATLNLSVNQTLSRTFLTSLTTLLALGSLYLLGGEVIQPFAKTMLIGVLVGTYSSIFIASPLLLFLEERYGDGGGPPKPKGPGINKAVV
ncbi:MAG: protein translocase subunit SecF [Myxococcota bacterium]